MNSRPSLGRRNFLAGVGQGTLIATIGPALAAELGLAPAALAAGDPPGTLDFGEIEPLVRHLQETPVAALQPSLVEKLRSGESLQRLIAAAALANARTFAGGDYIGFHTFMALAPALHMASLMPEKERALPVLKVLYRNTSRIAETGGRAGEVLRPIAIPDGAEGAKAGSLLAAVKARDESGAERILATMAAGDTKMAFDALLETVQENLEVHRTVLPYRAWAMIDIVGAEHATTLMRQSLHYCLNAESDRRPDWDAHGKILARLLDEHRLRDRDAGARDASDDFIAELSRTIFNGSPDDAAGAVAAALAEGYRREAIGEALALAANEIVLRDPGRIPAWEVPGKTVGSVHGDSVGVHASDSANAWRNLANTGTGRHTAACLILGAWQVARDRSARGQALLESQPVPIIRHSSEITEKDSTKLLAILDEAVRARMQARAAAVVHRIEALGHS